MKKDFSEQIEFETFQYYKYPGCMEGVQWAQVGAKESYDSD